MVAVEHDQPGAGAEDRLLEAADRVLEPVEPHQAHEGRRLSAGDDEAVEPGELLGLAHLDRVRAEPPQHRRVLAEVPLQGQDADPHARNSSFGLQELGAGDRFAPRRRASQSPIQMKTRPVSA